MRKCRPWIWVTLDATRGCWWCRSRLGSAADLVPQPNVSLPAAVGGGRAETEAVSRFFENDHFDFTDILTPPCDATLERIRAERVVVLAQETSEMDLTRPMALSLLTRSVSEGDDMRRFP